MRSSSDLQFTQPRAEPSSLPSDDQFQRWLDDLWYAADSVSRETSAGELRAAVKQIAAGAIRRYGSTLLDDDVAQTFFARLIPIAGQVSPERARVYVASVTHRVVLDDVRSAQHRSLSGPCHDGEDPYGRTPSPTDMVLPETAQGNLVLRADVAARLLHAAHSLAEYLTARVAWTSFAQPGDPARVDKRQWTQVFGELRKSAGMDKRGTLIATVESSEDANLDIVMAHAGPDETRVIGDATILMASVADFVAHIRASVPTKQVQSALIGIIRGAALQPGEKHGSLAAELTDRRRGITQSVLVAGGGTVSVQWIDAAARMSVLARVRARMYQRHLVGFERLTRGVVEVLQTELYPVNVRWGTVAALGSMVVDERRRLRLREIFEAYV
jgi:DNA-directed RNA polymerase specialized sigma24 family protein